MCLFKIEITRLLSVQPCNEEGANWRFEIDRVLVIFNLGEC